LQKTYAVNTWLIIEHISDNPGSSGRQLHCITRYHAKFITPPSSLQLMASLKKGNMQQVTMDVDGKETKMYIEANPRFRTLNIKDELGNPKPKTRESEACPSAGNITTQPIESRAYYIAKPVTHHNYF
jgi:hypothetical protein